MVIKNTSHNPTFSVILTTFNRPEMLKRAINSVLHQQFDDFELIVVDDGSTDEKKIYSKYISNNKFKFTKNETNRGVAEARNIGIEMSRGKYISFLDDDDEYLPSFLVNTYRKFRLTKEEIGVCWSSVKFINYCPKSNCNLNFKVRQFSDTYQTKIQLFEDFLSIGTGFGITFKSNCLKRIGFFNSQLRAVEDSDLFYRVLINGFLPQARSNVDIIVHNHHQKRLTDLTMHSIRISECKWLLSKYKDFLDMHPTLKAQLNNQINYLLDMKNENGVNKLCSLVNI